MTIAEAYEYGRRYLADDIDARELDNVLSILFEDCWEIRSSTSNEDFLYERQLKRCLAELKSGKPVQYVTNVAHFYGYQFYVNEHVLIPRPETEELVYWVVSDIKRAKRSADVLDIGTGSGCIPITVKSQLRNSLVFAMDVSVDALNVAQKNAQFLNTDVEFFESDFLEESEWKTLGYYDVIISNPPYIGKDEKPRMGADVVAYEPDIALYPEVDDPLIFYKKIALFGTKHLKPDGTIYVEINEFYATETIEIYEREGYECELREDLQGKPRMIKAIRP